MGLRIKKFNDTHIYCFDAGGRMVLHNYYPTQQEVSSDMLMMENGVYTFIAVLNVGEAFSPETRGEAPLHNVTMNQFISYVKQVEQSYPDMLTGMTNHTITTGKEERVLISLFDKSGGIQTVTTVVTATVTLPDAEGSYNPENRAWYLNFNDGNTHTYLKNRDISVRSVLAF